MPTKTYAPGAIKQDDGTGAVAVKMAASVTAYSWFVIDPAHGGYPLAEADAATVADWPDK
jgi:hypothetical protein